MLPAISFLTWSSIVSSSPILEDTNANIIHNLSPSSSEGAWLFGWAWNGGGVVSVVDRQPPISYDARPSSFGAKLEDSLMGYVIPLSSFTTECSTDESNPILLTEEDDYRGVFVAPGVNNLGCPKLCISGHHKPEPSETWIALVQRGRCSFVQKVRQAQQLGAGGVVIGGYNEEMINMYSPDDAEDITIPSTYIQGSSYDDLFGLIRASNTTTSGLRTVSIQMTLDYGAWEWYSPLLTFALLLLLPSILTFSTLLIHRIRSARARRRERAPQDIVSQLPWRVWGGEGWEKWITPSPPPSKLPQSPVGAQTETPHQPVQSTQSPDSNIDLEDTASSGPSKSLPEEETEHTQGSPLPTWFRNQTECVICLSDFANGDRVRILPCNHIFHVDEVDEWLTQRKKLCPVCKADVTRLIDAMSEPSSATNSRPAPRELNPTRGPATETTALLGPR